MKRARRRRVPENHVVVSMGRSSLACSCGWGVARTNLCETPEEDQRALRALHSKHIVKASEI